jgi:hypothetical protein
LRKTFSGAPSTCHEREPAHSFLTCSIENTEVAFAFAAGRAMPRAAGSAGLEFFVREDGFAMARILTVGRKRSLSIDSGYAKARSLIYNLAR